MSATAHYWIPHHVRACCTGANTVVLDLKRNRYFSVGLRETRALQALAVNWRDACTQASGVIEQVAPEDAARIAGALENAGLLTRTQPSASLPSARLVHLDTVLRDTSSQLSEAPITISHVLRFAHSCLWTRRALRRQSLFRLACELTAEKASAGARFDEAHALMLTQIFRRLRPYAFAAHDRCLFHALALTRFLSAYGVFPMWVIGVRMRPWAAHSWVQQGSLILDGSPEEVCRYTPIFTT